MDLSFIEKVFFKGLELRTAKSANEKINSKNVTELSYKFSNIFIMPKVNLILNVVQYKLILVALQAYLIYSILPIPTKAG